MQIANDIFVWILTIVFLVISYYIGVLSSTAKVRIQFTEEGYEHIWERRYLFSWEKDIKIPWDIIDTYVFEPDRTYDSFIINLTTGFRYKISKLTILPKKDDFEKLVKEFPRFANEYRRKSDPEGTPPLIRKGETFYETKGFRRVYYFFVAGFLFLLFAKLFDPRSPTPWGSLGVLGFGLAFYGTMMKKRPKK
ncbi:MAG: hypothetical protein PUB21_06880 [Bacteroidales bacterium]|nr:hypothetical protein [Bacteroidales bacterium]